MAKSVYNNVVDHRVMDGGTEVEDVTSVALPDISFVASDFKASGMAGTLSVPDMSNLEAMSLTINHNNGRNAEKLSAPGKHNIEFRIARQRLNVANSDLEYVGGKYRFVCFLKGDKGGTIERGNPVSGSNEYSVGRYEREVDGRVVTLIDIVAGIVKINGVDYSSKVRNLLK